MANINSRTYIGTSTDIKPYLNVFSGDFFYESDTEVMYQYNGDTWVQYIVLQDLITGGTYSSVTNKITFTKYNGRHIYVSGITAGGGGTFTGGTVTGATYFSGGLSASTISATTYQNLPINNFITGGTFNSGTSTLNLYNYTGGTIPITGFTNSSSGGIVTGGTYFSGGLSASTISATTYYNLPIEVYVTGGTYSAGTATFRNNTGGTFSVTGFSTGSSVTQGVTGVTGNNGVSASTTNNTTTIGFSGGTIPSSVNFTNGLTANTISATTYVNLPTDIRVTGGTYSAGTATFTNNTGGTFSVTGFSTGTSITQGITGITASNGLSASTTNNLTRIGFSGGTIPNSVNFTGGLTGSTIYSTSYSGNLVTSITAGNNISVNTGTGNVTVDAVPSGSQYLVQYNNGITFGSDAYFRWDYNNYNLTAGGGGNIVNAATYTSVVGGANNNINNGGTSAIFKSNSIFGGDGNSIFTTHAITNFSYNTVIGGGTCDISEVDNPTGVYYNAIVGGNDLHIIDQVSSIILGGEINQIYNVKGSLGYANTIVGGDSNAIYNNTPTATLANNTIIGGESNNIFEQANTNTLFNLIAVGNGHTIRDGSYNSIVGGTGHSILDSSRSAIIGGNVSTISSYNNVIILGGSGTVASQDDTTYVQNFNIYATPSNDDTLTQILVRDTSGFIRYRTASSFGSASSITGITASNGISASTSNNVTTIGFSGGSISSATRFTNGLTANTISATTYVNLPTDIRTTGGTYSNNNFTFTNNTGGTYSVLFNTVTGLTVNGNLTVTGSTTSTSFSGASDTITGTKGTVITSGSTTTAFITVSGSNTIGGASYVDFLRVTNTTAGATNATKTIRVNNLGTIEFLNSVYTATTLTLSDNGILAVGGGNSAGSSNNDATRNYLDFRSNASQIYDDGNFHIHNRVQDSALWINTNGGVIFMGSQTTVNGGSPANGIMLGGNQTSSLIGYVTILSGKSYTTSANYGYLTTGGAGTYPGGSQTVNVSLYATTRIWGQEIDAFSDERMKDIKGEIELDDAIKLVNNLKPIKYTWKEGDDKGLKAGYSAQQVVKAGFEHLIGLIPKEGLEETIDEDGFVSPKDTQFSMNYDQVTPYHGVVIKNLLERVEELERQIKELKNSK